MIDMDAATKYLKMSTDILFVKNPVATSMGTLFGIVVHGLFGLFLPFFQSIDFIKVASLNVFHFIALGVFGFNVKGWKNQHKVSLEIENAIAFINQQETKGLISEFEAKQQYRALISQAVKNVAVKNEATVSPQK
ncbi:hypothetical protein CWN85_10075 [Vibrio splendidus]|uniref:hypothetical protein n=1 Tax=Vibrio splendidus TaxID=29497 RepID=UPI000D38B4FA|nr:hypothetical protein [Vibrio splendidus]PTP09572.1 hypothetical protein CWN86_02720 [Vibrio splendidus]PTP23882.1 hypothetical protein CWN85_10075 [Vibrio splendidus]